MIIENGPPLAPSNNEMRKNFQDRLKCTGLHKLQHCLGARGKEEKLIYSVLIIARVLSPVVAH